MDNDKQDQGTASVSVDRSINQQDQTDQSISLDNTVESAGSSAPSPFVQIPSSPTSSPKKPPVKIIIAISLALVLIVGGTLAFLHLTNPDRIIREALEADADQSDRAVEYEAKIKSQSSIKSSPISFDSIKLQGEANWLGHKEQGSGTTNISITKKGQTTKLGEIGLAANHGKFYAKFDNHIIDSYAKTFYDKMNLPDQSDSQSISDDSPDVKVSAPSSQSDRARGLAKTLMDALANQWIELDFTSSANQTAQCLSKFMSDLSRRETKLEFIKTVMDSKFLNIKNTGAEKDNTVYQVSFNFNAWDKVTKKLEGISAYKNLHKCIGKTSTTGNSELDYEAKSDSGIQGAKHTNKTQKKCAGSDNPDIKCGGEVQEADNEVDEASRYEAINKTKQALEQSDLKVKLWIKGSLLGKHRLTKLNVKVSPSNGQKSVANSRLDLTVKLLDKRPNVTVPEKSMTIEQVQKLLVKLLGVSYI